MKKLLALVVCLVLAACSDLTQAEAREIAYQRLSTAEDRPSLHDAALKSALVVSEHAGGKFLVELRDEQRNLLWEVIVLPSGESEITRMAIDG